MKRVPQSGRRMEKENTKNAKMPLLLQPNNSKRSVCSFATRNTKIFQIKSYFQTVASFCIYAQVHRVIATKIRRKSLPVTQRNVKNIPNLFSFLSPSCFLFGTSFYNLERKRKKHDQKNCVIRKKKTRSEYCEYL